MKKERKEGKNYEITVPRMPFGMSWFKVVELITIKNYCIFRWALFGVFLAIIFNKILYLLLFPMALLP